MSQDERAALLGEPPQAPAEALNGEERPAECGRCAELEVTLGEVSAALQAKQEECDGLNKDAATRREELTQLQRDILVTRELNGQLLERAGRAEKALAQLGTKAPKRERRLKLRPVPNTTKSRANTMKSARKATKSRKR